MTPLKKLHNRSGIYVNLNVIHPIPSHSPSHPYALPSLFSYHPYNLYAITDEFFFALPSSHAKINLMSQYALRIFQKVFYGGWRVT